MIKNIKYDNGTVLVYEKLPHLRSVCIGIWIKSGSRYETSGKNGISHFLEHMLFKGTDTRTARDIADEFDGIGGVINGFTGKEATCYYSKTLDEHFDKSMEILSDMVHNYRMDPETLEREKKVIAEEMAMYADSPEDYVHDMLQKEMWKGDSLGYPVIGTRDNIFSFDRDMLMEYAEQHISPCNIVVAVAGNFEEKAVEKAVEGHFGKRRKGNGVRQPVFERPVFHPTRSTYEKDIEQTYLSIGFEAEGYGGPNRYALMASSAILGGGMSSRLFQNLREDKGLVYTVGAGNETYLNAGIVNIYAGTGEKEFDEAMGCIKEEVEDISTRGVTDEELDRAREQIKGGFILGMENTSTRMMYLGKNMLLKGHVEDQDEIVSRIDALTKQDIENVTARFLNWDKAAVSVLSSSRRQGEKEG